MTALERMDKVVIKHGHASSSARDISAALQNGLTLGMSLITTWSVALLVRLYLPRHLGPELFGALNFADSIAATFIILLDFGVDTYIRKEIPVRREHASDFFGGVITLRALLSTALLAALVVVMRLAGRPPEVQLLVFLFGVAYFVVALNGNLAALLHAAGTVRGLAIVNVTAKLLWGGGVGLAVVAGLGLPALAAAFLFAEVLRALVLLFLARQHVHLRLSWSGAAVTAVVVSSLPFYLNTIARTVCSKIDVSMLSLLAGDAEVGWYGSAANFAALAFLISPLISWVLLPLFSRAAARSEEELFALVRRCVNAIVMVVVPISLLMSVGAEVWIGALFGAAFAPAVLSLRILAPMIVLTYIATILATCLIRLDRAWTLVLISLGALVVSFVLSYLFIPIGMQWREHGGAGAATAAVMALSELGVTLAFVAVIGRRAFERSFGLKLVKVGLVCLVVIALDRALSAFGPVRLVFDALAYAALLFACRIVRVSDIEHMASLWRKHRRNAIP